MLTRTLRRLLVGLIAATIAAPTLAAVLGPVALAAGDPVPSVTVSAPASPLIGEVLGYDVAFSNTSADQPGYGPFVDLRMPLGADGNDGIAFTSATYLGAALETTRLTANASGCVTHPYAVDSAGAPVHVCGLAIGQSYVVLRLPFGSFTPGQPAATVHVTAQLSNLADAGTALHLVADGGFQFGRDALANPATDPSIIGPTDTADVTPTIIRVVKSYLGPESETATGPNYPRSYVLTATVAPGQTVTNLDLSDALPDSLQFVSLDSTTPASSAVSTPSTTVPGGILARRFASVTGTGGADAAVQFTYYVPRLDATSSPVLPAASGAFAPATDSASASGSWNPIDPRDSSTTVTAGPATHTLTQKSIAIQKGVVPESTPVGPGTVLDWTMSVQVSDFFALANVVVDDTVLDGSRFDATFTPTLTVSGNGFTSPVAVMNGANYTVGAVSGSGTTPISFRISDELAARGLTDTRLVGGCVNPVAGSPTPNCGAYDDGATTAVITFHSVVQDEYIDHDKVVEGDTLGNQASTTGALLDTGTLTPNGNTISDGTAASVTIQRGSLVKSIYAINGNTGYASPVHVAPSDTITYRLRHTFPTSRTDDFRMLDYLPLPVFSAAEVTTFDATAGAAAPAAGHAKYGPSDTFHSLASPTTAPAPSLSHDGTANSVTFSYGDYAANPPVSSVADILFTVTVSNDPFADGLYLTNQARSETKNTAGDPDTADAIIQITLDQPEVLAITKGIVATDRAGATFIPATPGPVTFGTAPADCAVAWVGGTITSAGLSADPINSDLSGVDAGDLVRFAVVVHNTGHTNAFDIQVNDTLPAGFVLPAGGVALCVTDGAGTSIATTDLGGGLLGSGLELVDGANGSLAAGVSSSGTPNAAGTNIAVVSYTLQVADTAVPKSTHTNTAGLLRYANADGAPSHLASPLTDSATATVLAPTTAKAMTATNRTHTSGNSVAVGEIVTYQVTLTIPEGSLPGATVVDTLPAGLALVGCDSVTASSTDVTTSLAGGFADACTGSNPAVAGSAVTFSLGTVTNGNRDNAVADTITLTYDAVVLNVATNIRGATLHNAAALAWTGGSVAATSAANVTVVEPRLTITKNANPVSGDAGDTITFQIVLSNATNANGADAFEAAWADAIPAGLTYVGGSLGFSGTAPTSSSVAGQNLSAAWTTFAQGATVTITYQATLDPNVPSGQVYTNTAGTTWTSLPGDVRTAQSTHSAVSTERTGRAADPGGAANTYAASASASVTVVQPKPVKGLVITSEAGTADPHVSIGEVARFRVTVLIPEGVTPTVTVTDHLPAGLTYLNDGTTKVAFVSNGTGMTSDTLSGAGLAVTGNETSVAGITPTFVLPVGAISGGPFGNGTDPVFAMGSLTNADSDADSEYAVVEFNALVSNVIGNQAGTALANTASVETGGTLLATSDPSTLTVAEPSLTIAKTASPTTGLDGGDAVTYTITVTNAAVSAAPHVAPAYDLNVHDVLNANLVMESVTPSVTGTWTDNSNIGANTLDGVLDRLDPGFTATFTIHAHVAATVAVGGTIANTVTDSWTSLPGANGTTPNPTGSTTPGAAATATGERTGADGNNPGVLNDYAGSASRSITLASPTAAKALDHTSLTTTAGTRVAVGEVVTYRVTLTIPEGTVPNARVVDTLPAGMTFKQCDSVVASSADVTTSLAGGFADACTGSNPTVAGQVVTFTLGNLSNANADNAVSETVILTYDAVIANVSANTRGHTLNNSALASWTGGSTAAAHAGNVAVVEPRILIVKSADVTNPHFGDVVTYTLTMVNAFNANGADAYDVSLADTLPSGMTYVAGSVAWSSGDVPTTLGESGGVITATYDHVVQYVTAGGISVLTYQARVGNPGSLAIGQSLTNAANVTWTSLPGTDANERTGAGGSVNTYFQNTAATVTVTGADLSITTDDGRTEAVAGAVLAYVLGYHNAGNAAATGVVISETVPVSTTFDAAHSTAGWSCPTGSPAGTACTLTVAGSVAAGASGSVTFAVGVPDPVAYAVNAVDNTATIADDGTNGTDPTPGNNTASDHDVVNHADLSLTKTVDDSTPDANQHVTFTITLRNAGPDGATNTVVADLLPAGLTYVSAAPSAGSAYDHVLGRWTVNAVASGGLATLSVVAAMTAASPAVNTAEITHADQGDVDSTPNNHDPTEDDQASVTVTPNVADLAVTKTVDEPHPNLGDAPMYTILATNNGPDTATGVVVHDLLPTGIVGIFAWPSVGSYSSATGDWTIGTLASGATVVMDILVLVGLEGTITNTAVISGAPFDLVPANNTDHVDVSQILNLVVTKSVGNPTPNVGDTVTFTVGVHNDGPNRATGAIIGDALPAGLTYVSSSTASGTYASGTWTLAPLASGADATLTITARVTTAGAKTNTASVTQVNEPQTSTADDSASATVTPLQADLGVTKTVDNDRPDVGESVAFTVTLTNHGPDGSTNVVIADPLPVGLTWSSDDSAGSYNPATGNWTVGSLAAGGTLSLTIHATVSASGDFTNTAGVGHADQYDPVAGNNTAHAGVSSRVADIAVAKTVDHPAPAVGSTVTFTVTATNNGPDAATLVVVSDLLPAGLTFASATPSQGSYDAGTGNWAVGSLSASGPGATATLTVTARVTGSGTIANTAALASLFQRDQNPANNSATATLTVPPAADLSLRKTVDNATPDHGDQVTFTLEVRNDGPDATTGMVVADPLPASLAYVTSTGAGTYNSLTGSWTIGNLAVGASAAIAISVTVSSEGATTNTAEVTASGLPDPDSTPGNGAPGEDDQASVTLNARGVADLSVTKTVDISAPTVGSSVTYTLVLANAGPDTATNVIVRDQLPAGLAYASHASGAYDPATGAWTVAGLASGASTTLTITATVGAPGTIVNTAEVVACDQADHDSTPGNGVPSEDDQASIPVGARSISDLAVVKTIDNRHPDVGSNVTFTITATNNGRDDATGVVVADPLPAGLAYVSSNATAGSYSSATGDWTVGPLAIGASATLTVVATVGVAGPIVNTANVTSDSVDSDLSNNTASASLDQLVDLVVTKTVDNPAANVGALATFTIGVRNAGPSSATGIVLHDVLPATLAGPVATPSQGTFDPATGTWTVGSLAPDATATLTIAATVSDPTPVTNTASIAAVDQPQVTTQNDSASASITPPQADLAVTKTVDMARPDTGDLVAFTVTLTNHGPDAATSVVVADPLPAGLIWSDDLPSRGTYDHATGNWTVGSLAVGETVSLAIHAVVSAGDYVNTATVAHADQYDPNAGNNTASAALSTRIADIAVTKVADTTTPAVGSIVTFTITATDNGPDPASQVVVTDLLPAGLAFASATASQGAYDAGTGAWTVGNLAVGASASLTVRARVTGSGSIANNAAVSHLLQRDPDPSNNAATATLEVPPAADLSLVKTVDNTAPTHGEQVAFSLVVANDGPNATTGVVVADPLPAGLTYVSSDADQGSYDSASGNWTVGDLAVGATATLAITVTVDAPGPLTNTAEITASGQPDPDSTPGNRAAGEDDQAAVTLNARGVADLALTKIAEVSSPVVGGLVTYTLNLANLGPDAATGVIVRDELPDALVYVGHAGGAFDPTTGAWTIDSLAVDATATLTITARIATSGSITNVGELVAADQADPDSTPGNAVASEDDQSPATISVPIPEPPATATVVAANPPGGGDIPAPLGIIALLVGLFIIVLVVTSRTEARPRRR
jgi:large repetitive protein